MPEINGNTSKIGKLSSIDSKNINEIIKKQHDKEIPIEKQVEIDLTRDPKDITGRSLVHSSKSKEVKELKGRVNNYTKDFINDKEKATFLMDSVDRFVEEGFSLEEATESTIKLAHKIGSKKIDLIKDVPGLGQSVAQLCISLMSEFNWDINKSIDVAAQAFNTIPIK